MQIDFAIAYKHSIQDVDYEASKLESIQEMLKPIGQALGVTYVEKKQKTSAMPDDLPVADVLALIGGKGTMVQQHGG